MRNNAAPFSFLSSPTACRQREEQRLNLFHLPSMLLESFGSAVKLLTALFVEFFVIYSSCSSICCSEMSCSEEKHNKAPSSIIG